MKFIVLFLFAVNSSAATIEDVSKKIGICLQNGQNPTVAVMDFEYINKTDVVSPQIIQERVTTALSRSKKVTIVERNLIEKVLKELSTQASGMLGPQETTKLGQMLNANYVLTGTLTDLEKNQVEINARVISVASSTVSCAERVIISKDWKTNIIVPHDPEINRLPENIKSQFELANLYLVNNAPEKSIEIFSDLLTQPIASIDSIKWELYLGRAHAYSIGHGQDSAAALADTEKVIALNPNSSLVYALRGLIYSRLDPRKYNYAIAEFSQAIKNAPDDQVLYALRANSELASRHFADARHDFKIALSTKTFNSNVKSFLFLGEFHAFLWAEDVVDNWLEISQKHLDHLSTYMTEDNWDYDNDIQTKIALTYALEKDSATSITHIANNFKNLPSKYPNTEAVFGIYFTLKDYTSAVKLCVQLKDADMLTPWPRETLIEGCSAAYRANKNYDLAIRTLGILKNTYSSWGMNYALRSLYLYESGKSIKAISDFKSNKSKDLNQAVSLVFAIIYYDTGKIDIAKKFFNIYLKYEGYPSTSDDINFWNKSDWTKGVIERNLWDYLTDSERNSFTALSALVKKDGPIPDDKLKTFTEEYFK